LASLSLVGQLGFIVAGSALGGLGIGYGIDLLIGGRAGRVAGLFLGLASGLWTAGRKLMRVTKERQGDKDL